MGTNYILARGLQGYIVGKIAWSKGRKGNSLAFNLIATIVSIPFMLGAIILEKQSFLIVGLYQQPLFQETSYKIL